MASSDNTPAPAFCPNSSCEFHLNPTGWKFKKAGFYTRQIHPQRIQRYRCTRCQKNFSSQTFSITYWLKQPDLLESVYHGILSCSAYRQMARFLGVSPNTIMGQVERLGRHCLLLHQWLRPKHAPLEPIVVDGFETFEFSQYFPHHINLAVGAHSHFRYAFTEAELRRKGRTTAAQKKRLAELDRRVGRPNPKALVTSMTDLIELVAPKGSRLVVRSDKHPAYPRAFKDVEQVEIVHETTSSKLARTARNPLFPVNRADLLIRHCGANHKRETIAYSKRRQSSMERHAIHEVWINYQKPFSEKKKDAPPAVKLGLIPHALTTREILRRRLFPRQIELPECWQRYYDREIVTRCIPNGKRHRLTYAY